MLEIRQRGLHIFTDIWTAAIISRPSLFDNFFVDPTALAISDLPQIAGAVWTPTDA